MSRPGRVVAASRLALLAALSGLVACEPRDHRPGFWLSGEVSEEPAAGWAFVDDVREVYVETRTWYGIPHSVTTVAVRHGGTFYVPSLYSEGRDFPEERFWNRNVVRDPRVRVKIGERIFERRAALVEDPEEWEAVLAAFARKLPFWSELRATPDAERPKVVFLRMDPPQRG